MKNKKNKKNINNTIKNTRMIRSELFKKRREYRSAEPNEMV